MPKIDELKLKNDDLQAAVKNAKGLMTSGSANSVVYVNDVSSRSRADIQVLAQKVSDIVLDVIRTDDTPQLCFAQLNRNDTDAAIRYYCGQLFDAAVQGRQTTLLFAKKLLETAATTDDVIKAWTAWNNANASHNTSARMKAETSTQLDAISHLEKGLSPGDTGEESQTPSPNAVKPQAKPKQ